MASSSGIGGELEGLHPPGLQAPLLPGRGDGEIADPNNGHAGLCQGVYLVVSDIEAARDQLAGRGVQVSAVFYPSSPGAQFQTDGTSGRVGGRAPDHASYGSFATFSDPESCPANREFQLAMTSGVVWLRASSTTC